MWFIGSNWKNGTWRTTVCFVRQIAWSVGATAVNTRASDKAYKFYISLEFKYNTLHYWKMNNLEVCQTFVRLHFYLIYTHSNQSLISPWNQSHLSITTPQYVRKDMNNWEQKNRATELELAYTAIISTRRVAFCRRRINLKYLNL